MVLESANSLKYVISIFSPEKFTDLLDDTEKVDSGSHTNFTPLEQLYLKNMRSKFTDHVISSNELCNQYTGFPSVDVLSAVFKELVPGINCKNVILYNYQKIKSNSSAAERTRK